jgi:imidazolonepropionase-like amidohydrolase
MRIGRLAVSVAIMLAAGSAFAAPAKPPKDPPPPREAPNLQGISANDRYVPAPARRPGEGAGPFKRLVIRGVTIVDGEGAPPRGPVDVVIEGNRIADIRNAGTPGMALKANREPRDFDQEIDATGMFMLPGFVDTHCHGSNTTKAANLSYAYKLWLAHGVTTVRCVVLADFATSISEKHRSAANEIAAPRIFNYQTLGAGWGRVDTPERAREWVRWAAATHEVDGIKFFNRGDETPAIDRAALDEAKKFKLGTVAHLSQNNVAAFNADDAGAAGLQTITHFYGHFEALLKDRTIQDFPATYNYENEAMRFGEVANIRNSVYGPETPQWHDYLKRQLDRGVTFDPTFVPYMASRDLMRARTAEWHEKYTTPRLLRFFESTRDNHGSYFYDWTTENEVAWKQFFQLFEKLVFDYKNMGGRITVGSDTGFIWQIWGFSYIEELEMLREAGLTPLEVIRAATADGAAAIYRPIGEPAPFGMVRRGMLADLVIVPENPLANLKVLYGTGHIRLNDQTNKVERVGGVRYTVKDGVVYDAHALLKDVADMVAEEKAQGAPPK